MHGRELLLGDPVSQEPGPPPLLRAPGPHSPDVGRTRVQRGADRRGVDAVVVARHHQRVHAIRDAGVIRRGGDRPAQRAGEGDERVGHRSVTDDVQDAGIRHPVSIAARMALRDPRVAGRCPPDLRSVDVTSPGVRAHPLRGRGPRGLHTTTRSTWQCSSPTGSTRAFQPRRPRPTGCTARRSSDR